MLPFSRRILPECSKSSRSGIGGRVVRSATETQMVRDALAAYLEGDPTELSFPVDLSLMHSGFRRTVLEHLRKVGRGHVITYGELARRAGSPRAARAVGTACATNPVPLIVPCHRVLPSGGGVGNYGGGPEKKVFLLELEGALGAGVNARPSILRHRERFSGVSRYRTLISSNVSKTRDGMGRRSSCIEI